MLIDEVPLVVASALTALVYLVKDVVLPEPETVSVAIQHSILSIAGVVLLAGMVVPKALELAGNLRKYFSVRYIRFVACGRGRYRPPRGEGGSMVHTARFERRARVELAVNLSYIKTTGQVLAFALPLALLALPWPWRSIGVVYAVVWGTLVASSTGAMMTLAYDAILMLLNRPPIVLPKLLYLHRNLQRHPHRRALQSFNRFAEASAIVNPLGNIVTALLMMAIRLHPHHMRVMATQIAQWEAADTERKQDGNDFAEPTLEFSTPVIAHVAPPRVSAEQRDLLPA